MPSNLFDAWMEALDNLDSINDIEDEEILENLEMDGDILRMTYSDGTSFREENPYPAENITSFPQEKLSHTRNQKISLQRLFVVEVPIDEPML
mgnify:CR=1 FL=1